MLSIENPPPDLPCSCEASQLKSSSDERASDKVVNLLKSSPKFSIRDYVFSARNKDIRTNWPFSQKNLQLCLKHGMKDLLPPFQPLDSVRNRLAKTFPIETNPINSENAISNSDDHFESIGFNNAGCNEKTDTTFVCINPEINSESPAKKCRSIVKLGNGDNMSNLNCVTVSETMASKVCPVCKTFTSSSNTTLNAHIDQCLSVESTIKVIKHRVKPRKVRLMVDIYSTASHCTLEELDRRNGTSWAMNTQKNDVCDEEKRQRVLSVNVGYTGDESDVYVDANGTKVRILSNSNELSMPKEVSDPRICKILKGGKRNKFLSVHKKNRHVQKHQRYIKLDPRSKKLGSLKPHRGSEIHRGLERNRAAEESREKEEHLGQPFREQIKLDDSRNMRKRLCTKQTGVSKKAHCKKNLQHLGYNLRQDLRMESDLSSLGDSRENSSYEVGVNQRVDQPPLRKRDGFSSFGSRISDKMDTSVGSKHKSKQLRKDSEDNSFKGSSRENLSSPRNKPVKLNAELSRKSGAFSSKATLRKKFSVKQSYVPESSGYSNGKYRAPEKPLVNWVAKLDEQPLRNHAKIQLLEEITEQVPLGSCGVVKVKKKRGGAIGNFTDTCHDIQSAGKRVRSHGEDIISEPSSKVAIGVSVVSPSKSSDSEDQFADVFKGSFYGPSEPSLGDEEEMYGPDDVSPNTHIEAELDSNVGHENYFSGVDPIPIPGPPGSFLPSPRGMSSEDLQGNSLFTTSRLQSSEDHYDRDSSDSPVSAISNISNSATMVRSDSKSSEQLASAGLEKVNLDYPKVNVTILKKEQPLGFKNNQPCCCSRKEGTKQGLVLNYKESQLLMRRTMSSMPLPAVLKQTGSDQTKRISEKEISSDSAINFLVCGCESGNPSPSNSVLRLMGKDLMVINRYEDSFPKLCESHSGVPNDNPNPQNRLIFGQNRGFNVESSKSFSSHVASMAVFPRIMEPPHEYQGGYKPDPPIVGEILRKNTNCFLANTSTQHPNAAIPMISDFDARQTDPYYVGSSPLVDNNASFQMTSFRRSNSSPFKGNCTSDGSSSLYPSSLTTSSLTIGDLRSSKFSITNELCFK